MYGIENINILKGRRTNTYLRFQVNEMAEKERWKLSEEEIIEFVREKGPVNIPTALNEFGEVKNYKTFQKYFEILTEEGKLQEMNPDHADRHLRFWEIPD